MAKTSVIQRERKRRCLSAQCKGRRDLLVKEVRDSRDYRQRVACYARLAKEIPRDAAPSRSRNRCVVTGRGRGVYGDFGLSRHVLREMWGERLIPGLRKSSW
jgi:small subunit ribosomal protein S14